jgi:hypothetical protein
LNASETAMKEILNLPKASHVSDYENGLRRPSLMVVLAYSRLGKVTMDSLVDDDVSLTALRRQLGTYDYKKVLGAHITADQQTSSAKSTQRKKPPHSKRLYLAKLIEPFNEYQLVLDVRHRSWNNEDLYEWLVGIRI